MTLTIPDSCSRYTRSLIEAASRASSAEDFWDDQKVSKSYQQLLRSVTSSAEPNLHWKDYFWEITFQFGDAIRKSKKIDAVKSAKELQETLTNVLADLNKIEWVALVPLDRRFAGLGSFVEFFHFTILNAKASSAGNERKCIADIIRILNSKLKVRTENADRKHGSYNSLAHHFAMKSRGYIPGHPLLFVNLGRGSEQSNSRLLNTRVALYGSLLSLCQIAYDTRASVLESSVITTSRQLDGSWHSHHGLTEIPGVAVAINSCDGNAKFWYTRQQAFESEIGMPYKRKLFMRIWKEIASPVLDLHELGIAGSFRTALENGISLVARCRHREMGNLLLNSVIATETILSRNSRRGSITEMFALNVASMTEKSGLRRRLRYAAAKHLYRKRSEAVHASLVDSNVSRNAPDEVEAFNMFLQVLNCIVRWATVQIRAGRTIEDKDFDEFYLGLIFP